MKLKPTSVLDILGISSATICLMHCLIFPLLTILPFAFIQNHYIDTVFASIGIFVVSKIVLSEANFKIKFILGCSIILVIIGISIEILLDYESWLILVGGLGMIIGHLLNFKSYFKKN